MRIIHTSNWFSGHSGKSQLYRNGEFLMDILNDMEYSYESPVFHTFDPPIVLLPGDSIVTTCQFNSFDGHRRRENDIFYGDGTQVRQTSNASKSHSNINRWHIDVT